MECRFIAASGMLGMGVNEEILCQALELKPHFVAADAGTTDAGPFALGMGIGAFPREAILRDMRVLLRHTRPAGIPLIIGSVGTAGADVHVDNFMEIVREAVTIEGLSLRVAEIRAEQDKQTLVAALHQGRIRALDSAPALDVETIVRSTRIVGMMGVEPLQAALDEGVDLIVAGRCSDPALYAAMPLKMGLPAGLAWHAGKVVECGPSVCERPALGMVAGFVREHEVVIRPIGAGLRCTTQSVAAHSLYENADPFLFTEASGVLDVSESVYEQIDDISVRIRGSRFIPATEHTIKLEGAEMVGYQSILVGGVRDPFILAELDTWLSMVEERVHSSVANVFGQSMEEIGGRIDFHVYGRDGVMGALEPRRPTALHEVGIVVEATAPEQRLATALAQLTRQPLLHQPISKWKGSITGFACLHNPSCIDRGPVYQFTLNHVVLPATPTSMFRTRIVQLEGIPGEVV